MAARESEIEMTLEILDEVAFLFVEQFDNLYGMLVDRTDVKRIRKSADDGEDIEACAAFVKFAAAQGLVNLKGHRLVGGMRASIYNAMPVEGVTRLVEAMKQFEAEGIAR